MRGRKTARRNEELKPSRLPRTAATLTEQNDEPRASDRPCQLPCKRSASVRPIGTNVAGARCSAMGEGRYEDGYRDGWESVAGDEPMPDHPTAPPSHQTRNY